MAKQIRVSSPLRCPLCGDKVRGTTSIVNYEFDFCDIDNRDLRFVSFPEDRTDLGINGFDFQKDPAVMDLKYGRQKKAVQSGPADMSLSIMGAVHSACFQTMLSNVGFELEGEEEDDDDE